jgi:hypothetical protein
METSWLSQFLRTTVRWRELREFWDWFEYVQIGLLQLNSTANAGFGCIFEVLLVFIRLELVNWTTSRKFREPCCHKLSVPIHSFQTLLVLTSVNILYNILLLGAPISSLPGLVCELWAVASILTPTSGVHSSLQWVTLPTKNVITMLTETSSSNLLMKIEPHFLGVWLTCHQYWKRTAESRLQATRTCHWIALYPK